LTAAANGKIVTVITFRKRHLPKRREGDAIQWTAGRLAAANRPLVRIPVTKK